MRHEPACHVIRLAIELAEHVIAPQIVSMYPNYLQSPQITPRPARRASPVSDMPEDLARRDNAAIAHVASLRPVNADEANLAAT
jgi:hypothetical protein